MNGNYSKGETDMQQNTSTVGYGLDQYRRDCIALRIKLGITSNRMTEEQWEICQEAENKLWFEKFPKSISGGPEPRPETRS